MSGDVVEKGLEGSEAPGSGLEARLARLEAIVARLEQPDLELEEALALFEEGVAHLRAAREVVQHTELRVQRLLEEADDSGTTAAEDGG